MVGASSNHLCIEGPRSSTSCGIEFSCGTPVEYTSCKLRDEHILCMGDENVSPARSHHSLYLSQPRTQSPAILAFGALLVVELIASCAASALVVSRRTDQQLESCSWGAGRFKSTHTLSCLRRPSPTPSFQEAIKSDLRKKKLWWWVRKWRCTMDSEL